MNLDIPCLTDGLEKPAKVPVKLQKDKTVKQSITELWLNGRNEDKIEHITGASRVYIRQVVREVSKDNQARRNQVAMLKLK